MWPEREKGRKWQKKAGKKVKDKERIKIVELERKRVEGDDWRTITNNPNRNRRNEF